MRHDHHEFLTAVSPTDIAASCVSFKYFGKCFQDLITGVVSEGIVDLFKAVQIGDNDPERIIMSGGAADFARPPVLDGTPVRQTSQAIGQRELFELLILGLDLPVQP